MSFTVRFIACLALALFLFTGCVKKPVRHLASDASLIKAGVSTRDDVYTMLGEPDAQHLVSEDVEEWVYYQEELNASYKAPLVGQRFEMPAIKGLADSKGYGVIVLTIKGDLVTTIRYNSFEEGDRDWAKNYEWQENEEK